MLWKLCLPKEKSVGCGYFSFKKKKEVMTIITFLYKIVPKLKGILEILTKLENKILIS